MVTVLSNLALSTDSILALAIGLMRGRMISETMNSRAKRMRKIPPMM
jgi:hypothetical protein